MKSSYFSMSGLPQATTTPFLGIDDTLKKMYVLVQGPRGEQSWPLRALVEDIIRFVRPKDKVSIIAAVYRWFQNHWSYVYDPNDVELIKDPEVTADEIREKGRALGDCDDATVFIAAALRTVGVRTALARVGFGEEGIEGRPDLGDAELNVPEQRATYSHVFVIAEDQFGRIIVLDPVAAEITPQMIHDAKQVAFGLGGTAWSKEKR